MTSEESILFKDKITRKDYTILVKKLLNAIDMGEGSLKKVLIGCGNPELYSSHGTYQKGGHNHCDGSTQYATELKPYDGVFLTHYHGDHICLISGIMEPIPIFSGESAIDILSVFSERVQNSYKDISGSHPLTALKPITVGDIKVMPIPADHSAYDAYMFPIEAEGKRILHTGDFRLHGFRGKATPKLLYRYAQA
ncbi:MAG: MBL fold metallo-hydrolase [Lachnospiraceae bacterium]|nr:MBL fold metallo-hydrolase [Lachnospiraceae bacterium]